VPVAVLEGDEARAADSGDGFDAGRAALGEQLAEAIGTVGLLVAAGEALAGQAAVAVGAGEALPVPGLLSGAAEAAPARDALPNYPLPQSLAL